MGNRKRVLNRAEQAQDLNTLRQLQAEGVNCVTPEKLLTSFLDITVAGGPANSVFEGSKGMFYAIWVRLVAKRAGTLLDCRIRTDWDDHIVVKSFDDERPLCKIGSLDYSRAEVLNHRIQNGLRFERRGDWFEGMILANGLRPIPEKYRDGAIVPFQLTFEDEFGEEISQTAKLSVARTEKQRPTEQRGTGLYGRRSSSESSHSAAPGYSRGTKRSPAVPDYGDDALGLRK